MKFWPFGKKEKKKVQFRQYAAAGKSRLLDGFNTSSTSQDTELRSSLPQLRARSRELARNNDYVRNALRIIRNNVVGQGIPFQAQVRKQRGKSLDDAMNSMIESTWSEWCRGDSCDVAGKLSFQDIEGVIMSTVPKNGETIIRIHRQKFGKSRVPLALELMASDMLDETFNRIADGTGNEIRMGVEIDQWRRPIAYWFHAKDPGDWTALGTYSVGRRIRVDAKDIIHLGVPENEHETRFAPWFSSAMIRLHHMQGLEEATIIRSRAEASVMGFITSPEGQVKGDDVIDGQRVTDMEPGAFKYLGEGENVTPFAVPSSAGSLDPFMKMQLRGVSSGIGISYESLSKDYSGATYSSARQALLEDRDNWKNLQQWLIRNFHQRVFEEWLDMAYLAGVLEMPLYATRPDLYKNVRWLPRGWTWIDPLKEVEAYKSAVRSGFMTASDVVAQAGGDFEELMGARRRELDLCESLNIVLDTDPNLVNGKGQMDAGAAAPIAPANENNGKAP